jgi:hypothetical protein
VITMETLRASGVQTGGPDSLSQRDRQQFAAELEKWLFLADNTWNDDFDAGFGDDDIGSDDDSWV